MKKHLIFISLILAQSTIYTSNNPYLLYVFHKYCDQNYPKHPDRQMIIYRINVGGSCWTHKLVEDSFAVKNYLKNGGDPNRVNATRPKGRGFCEV